MDQTKTQSALTSRLVLLVGLAALGLGVLGHELSSAYLVAQSFRPLDKFDQVIAPFQFDGIYAKDPSQLTRLDFERALEDSEARFEKVSGYSIKQGQRKHIVWPDGDSTKDSGRLMVPARPYQKAELALVYLHGFSAGPLELEPTISNLAKDLGAPVVFTRLAGHGLTNSDEAANRAFAQVKARDWWIDANEAMALASLLAKRVVLIGTSTGAALALNYADVKEQLGSSDVPAGLILLSPNYRVQAFGAWLLEAALGRWLATIFIGPEREFSPVNELHAERWTTRYRSEAVHEMLLVAKRARGVNLESLSMPVLTVFVPEETVVDTSEIRSRAKLFKNPNSQTLAVDWLKRHELASAAFDQEMVPKLVETLSLWVRGAIEVEIGAREQEAKSRDR
jgi:alpha-beta hydrolase superfamily lysophospholipase